MERQSKQPPAAAVGFSTASGKQISVSDEAIAVAKKKLQLEETTTPGMVGFSTASGKQIEVSEEAIATAKNKLQLDEPTTPGMVGFSTASGKHIYVSDEAVATAKSKLQLEETTTPGMVGFSTASGKQIDVSEDVIATATNKLQIEETTTPVMVGFSTASGKHIDVSKEAIAKAKNKLQLVETATPGTVGFSTASGIQIDVSDEAVCVAKSKLQMDVTTKPVAAVVVQPSPAPAAEKSTCKEDEDPEYIEAIRMIMEDIDDDPSAWSNASQTCTLLSSIQSKGELICEKIKLAIIRSYPVAYFQQKTKAFLSEANFQKLRARNLVEREKLQENLLPGIQQKVREQLTPKTVKNLTKLKTKDFDNLSLEDLVSHVISLDESSSQSCSLDLSASKREQLEEERLKFEDRVRTAALGQLKTHMKNLEEEMKVSPVLKLRVLDMQEYVQDNSSARNGMLCVWHPNSTLSNELKEGNCFEFQYLQPNAFESFQEVRLSTTKGTVITPVENPGYLGDMFSRKLSSINDIVTPGFSPMFDEFDTVGVVTQIDVYKEGAQVIHLGDQLENTLKVKFWKSLKDLGLADVITTGKVLACSNLQWQIGSAKMKVAFVQAWTEFTSNPKASHLKTGLQELQKTLQGTEGFTMKKEEEKESIGTSPALDTIPRPRTLAERRFSAKRRLSEGTSSSHSDPHVASASKRGRLSTPFVPPYRKSK